MEALCGRSQGSSLQWFLICHCEPVRAAKQVPLGCTLAWQSVISDRGADSRDSDIGHCLGMTGKAFHAAGCTPRALVSLRGHPALHIVQGSLYSTMTLPLFRCSRSSRIMTMASATGSLVWAPVVMFLQDTMPAAISSSPRNRTKGTPSLSA